MGDPPSLHITNYLVRTFHLIPFLFSEIFIPFTLIGQYSLYSSYKCGIPFDFIVTDNKIKHNNPVQEILNGVIQ